MKKIYIYIFAFVCIHSIISNVNKKKCFLIQFHRLWRPWYSMHSVDWRKIFEQRHTHCIYFTLRNRQTCERYWCCFVHENIRSNGQWTNKTSTKYENEPFVEEKQPLTRKPFLFSKSNELKPKTIGAIVYIKYSQN